jgi:excisionase family DNA binding protein
MTPKRRNTELDAFRLLCDKRRTATILSVSTRTIEKLFYEGKLPAIRIGRRLLFHVNEIERFARRGAA